MSRSKIRRICCLWTGPLLDQPLGVHNSGRHFIAQHNYTTQGATQGAAQRQVVPRPASPALVGA
eukprot:15462224-Alexandrium_andersonii.AAC.1